MFLFGQDWVMFSAIHGHRLVFALDFTKSEILLWRSLIVPQAWTLGVELSFYLIAPFVLFKRRVIWTLLFLSLTIRALFLLNGIGLRDPWTYRFFPTELAFFLIGALAQQLLLPLYQTFSNRKLLRVSRIATVSLIAYSLLYFVIPGAASVKSIILFAIFTLLLPLTFVFQNHHKWDRRIGELSYPIYIGHMLVIWTLSEVAGTFLAANPLLSSILDVLGSIVFAILLNSFIGKKFERLRAKLKDGGKKEAVRPA
jgi:peptidoglycan/LPS O-acetylase OafA/YrhL